MSAPLTYEYMGDGEMRTLPHLARQADKDFVVGERCRLERADERSDASHKQYFAEIHEIFSNLPEHLNGRWRDDTSMRKWALCETGFCEETRCVAKSMQEAAAIALAFSKDYDWMQITDNELVFRKARSQSYRNMGKREFQRSKTAVLELLSSLIGVDTETLSANAGRAA